MTGEVWIQVAIAVLVLFSGVVTFSVQQIIGRLNREQQAHARLESLVADFVVASEKRLTRLETLADIQEIRPPIRGQ